MQIVQRKAMELVAGLVAAGGIAAILLPGAPASAAGPNLVTNGDFAVGVSGWAPTPATGTTTWSNGHAVLTVTTVNAGQESTYATQCVDGIAAGQAYEIAADVSIPPGQSRHGMVAAAVQFFSGPGCGGGNKGAISTPQWGAPDGLWHQKASTKVAPAGSVSARVDLGTTRYAISAGEKADAPFQVWFDNVSLTAVGAAPPPPTNTPVPPTKTPAPTSTPGSPNQSPPAGTPPAPVEPPYVPPYFPPVLDAPAPASPPAPVATKTATPAPTSAPRNEPEPVKQAPATAPAGTNDGPTSGAPLPPATGTGIGGRPRGHASTAVGLALLGLGATAYAVSRRTRS